VTASLVSRKECSPNFNERKVPISMVVLHYTEMKPLDTAIQRLCDPQAQVSAHYLISEEGEVISLVEESDRAWHAGKSYWRGERDVNSASIGIELDHPGHGLGYRNFSSLQIEALIPLLGKILKEHQIPRSNVVGHSDVAPGRKTDPGELFPWDLLASYKLCLSKPSKLDLGDPFPNDGAFFLALERFGYDISNSIKAVEAFQRRWRPELINGKVDQHIGAILFQLLLNRDRGLNR
jgi:N-acetylmuramoyl-L-alanine amidase